MRYSATGGRRIAYRRHSIQDGIPIRAIRFPNPASQVAQERHVVCADAASTGIWREESGTEDPRKANIKLLRMGGYIAQLERNATFDESKLPLQARLRPLSC